MLIEGAQQVIHFPYALFGFEESHYFFFKKDTNLEHYFYIEEYHGKLRFILSDPFYFFPDYTPIIERRDIELLHIKEGTPLLLLAIVNAKVAPPRLHLGAPLLIDWEQKKGKQILVTYN